MTLENTYLTLRNVSSHYGKISIDSIGYDNIQASICVPRNYFISAHAPSKFVAKFKNSGKIYVNCNINRTTGTVHESLRYTIKCDSLVILNCAASLEYHTLYVMKDKEYIFEIQVADTYASHTLWSFCHQTESLSVIEQKAVLDANNRILDSYSDYDVIVQTCNPRKTMALRCVTSFLNNVGKLPKNLFICSVDNINDGDISFPSALTFLCGKSKIIKCLQECNLEEKTISHVLDGFKNGSNPNMWLKYILPRLYIKSKKVLVMDDDVLTMGKCDELINSNAYMTFMNDSGPFYGDKTIEYYNRYFKTDIYKRIPPYVCAGVYMLNKQNKEYSKEFVNGLILNSTCDQDEQAACGLEIINNENIKILSHPKYHHGGWEDQTIDIGKLELIHMQGRAVHYRSDMDINNIAMAKRSSNVYT